MFEKEDGDVFQKFTKQGASANAFTSFTRTAYLFSATSQILENLKTLIDMVQEPYFTEKTVEKEKGIIGQEIQMYNDNRIGVYTLVRLKICIIIILLKLILREQSSPFHKLQPVYYMSVITLSIIQVICYYLLLVQ